MVKELAPAPSGGWSIPGASVWAGFFLGPLFLIAAYSYAATHNSDQLHYDLFWAGMLLAFVPSSLRLCMTRVPRAERIAIVSALGFFCYLPKLLLDPTAPLYFDELAHWRQSQALYQTHVLFQPNPMVSMARFFPGLHTLTVDLRYFTGLSTFQVGEVLVSLIHLLAVLGIFVLAEKSLGSSRVAGLAALVYTLNPAFMYFDSQYAYESLAIGSVIWTLVAIVHLQSDRRNRAGWLGAAALLSAACIVTHHLSTYFLTAIVLFIAAVTMVRYRRGAEQMHTAWLTLGLSVAVAAGAAAWAVTVAPAVGDYLGPYLTSGATQLAGILTQHQAPRALYAHSDVPGYERLSAVLSPLIMFAASLLGLVILWRRRPTNSAGVALMVCGLLYFGSIPFMLTGMASEGARRSWALSYIGLALLVAPTVPWTLQRAQGARRSAVAMVVASLLSIVLVGNVSMFVNAEYRFPGPYVYGSDTRSLDAELLGAVNWFRVTYGERRGVIADRDTGMAFYAGANERIAVASRQFPVWKLYFQTTTPDGTLFDAMRRGRYDFLVVDRRMSRLVPLTGVYLVRDEPGALHHTAPIPKQALAKFSHLPWAIKVYATSHLAIYRIDYGALRLRIRTGKS